MWASVEARGKQTFNLDTMFYYCIALLSTRFHTLYDVYLNVVDSYDDV